MKKIVIIATLLLVAFTACKKDNEPDGEGIYLGIVGFNENLTKFDIRKLTQDSRYDFTDFIYSLSAAKGTSLYYADYTALQMMKKYSQPPKLKNVALVTFTDGLDNVSISIDDYNPEHYTSLSAYCDGLHNKIMNEKIHGLSIQAYTIGLKGDDVNDEAMFSNNMNKLASSSENVFRVANMNEAIQRFTEIAESLNSTSTSVNVGVDIPGGYDDGQVLRFTFDNATTATSTNLYIEATFHRTSGRTLENISYNGFLTGASTLSATTSGTYCHFQFDDLKYTNGTSITQNDIAKIKLWKKNSAGNWDKESEFDPTNSSTTSTDNNSALIVLVLDCTTSLGTDFARMQNAAQRFVDKLSSVASSK